MNDSHSAPLPAPEPSSSTEGEHLRAWHSKGLGHSTINDVSFLRFTGADRARFLHGQCTQEVKARLPGQGGSAFVLDPKGRNLGEIQFLVLPDEILVALPVERMEQLRAWFQRFVVASDVRIEGDARIRTLFVVGVNAPDFLHSAGLVSLPEQEGSATSWDHARWVVSDLRTGAPGFLVLDRDDSRAPLEEALAAAGSIALDATDLEVLRVLNSRPRFGRDIDESTLPVESGQFERTVSLTKGCYSGQEVVARQHFLGKPRRQLAVLLLPELAQVGDAVRWTGKNVGTLTSLARSPTDGRLVGLAMLREGAANHAEELLIVRGEAEVGTATVSSPPRRP